jgi:Flp pilus assembly pilin Flp
MIRELQLPVRQAAHQVPAARAEAGQAMVEYALIIACLVILAVTGLTATGTDVASLLSKVANGFP